MVDWAARKGLATPAQDGEERRQSRHLMGVRGETFAYWYLRRHGYVMDCRTFRAPGIKGTIDLIGSDGPRLSFIESKNRTDNPIPSPLPDYAATLDKPRLLRPVPT